jgi:hypothetical protein
MASLDRMEVDDNSSDGEYSDEENPYELQEQTRRLARARLQNWDAAVARNRRELKVGELPGDRCARRNTAQLMADLRRLRQLSGRSSRSPGSGATWAI